MKKEIHPEYGPVAFRDYSTGDIFLTKSTLVNKPGLKTVEIIDKIYKSIQNNN